MPRQKTLIPVRPAPLIEVDYRARLERLTEQMNRSVLWWVRACYRANQSEVAAALAQDEAPWAALRRTVRRLARRWQRRFDELAPDLASHFATAVKDRSDVALARNLRRGGMSVRFKMTRPMNDVMGASIQENVALIKSIPSAYFSQVEGLVMRSVASGRDLGYLSQELEKQFGVTKRRAALISRDQNNKMTGTLQRVRQAELGIQEAIWVHSGGGKVPRPSHVKAGREQTRYPLSTGWFDPNERKLIFPGELVNCRCVSRPIVPGFS